MNEKMYYYKNKETSESENIVYQNLFTAYQVKNHDDTLKTQRNTTAFGFHLVSFDSVHVPGTGHTIGLIHMKI